MFVFLLSLYAKREEISLRMEKIVERFCPRADSRPQNQKLDHKGHKGTRRARLCAEIAGRNWLVADGR